MSATVEDQLSSYVSRRLDGAPAVTVDEVLGQPGIGGAPGRRGPTRGRMTLRAAAVLLVAGATGSVLVLRATSNGHAGQPKPSATSTTLVAGSGRVCGVVRGSGESVPIDDHPPGCPSMTGDPAKSVTLRTAVTIKRGKTVYIAGIEKGRWSAVLPAGTYEAFGFMCGGQPTQFTVTAGQVLEGVVVNSGCFVGSP